MSSPRTVIAVGMATRDTYFEMDCLPATEGKYCARPRGCYCGGMATNVAIALRILGHHVLLVHSVGSDANGQSIEETLRSQFQPSQLLSCTSSASFASLVFVEPGTSRRLAILTDGDYPDGLSLQQERALGQADFVYHDGSWPLDGALLRARAGIRNAEVMVNLEFPHSHLAQCYEWADYIVHSPSYLGLPEDCTPAQVESTLRTVSHSNAKLLGVTLGAKGSLFLSRNTCIEVGAHCVTAVDTNGAGDAFQAGLIHGLLSEWNHDCCLRFATALAAVQCTVLGPNLSTLTLEQVMNRMESLHESKNQ